MSVGEFPFVRMDRFYYKQAVTATKPTQCALLMIDRLVPKHVLEKSSVHGTNDLLAINPTIMNAIRGES